MLLLTTLTAAILLTIYKRTIPNNNPRLMYLYGKVRPPVKYIFVSIVMAIAYLILIIQFINLIFNFNVH